MCYMNKQVLRILEIIIALTWAVKVDSSASLSPLEGKMDGRRRPQKGSLKVVILR